MTPTRLTAIQIDGKMYLREENLIELDRDMPWSFDPLEEQKMLLRQKLILCLFDCAPGDKFVVGVDVELVNQWQDVYGDWGEIESNWNINDYEINNFKTRLVYQLILQDTIGQGEKIKDFGHDNHLHPCPFCAGTEADKVVCLGYKHPYYRVTCVRCGCLVEDDRKDKVQAAWNMRNGVSWIEQPKEQPQSETVEQAAINYAKGRYGVPKEYRGTLDMQTTFEVAQHIAAGKEDFIAGSSYERQKTEAIIKKVLERKTETELIIGDDKISYDTFENGTKFIVIGDDTEGPKWYCSNDNLLKLRDFLNQLPI